MKYQNATRAANEATFVEVGLNNGSTLTVRSIVQTHTPVKGVRIPMASGSVRLVVPHDVTDCASTCTVPVLESVEIKFNTRKGVVPTAILAEVNRIIGEAFTSYNLALGLVPPSEATFETSGG